MSQTTEGKPSTEIMHDGKIFIYDRKPYEDERGGVPLSQLRDDEIVNAQGIYREVLF